MNHGSFLFSESFPIALKSAMPPFKKIRDYLGRMMLPPGNSDGDYPDFACVGFPKCATTFILNLFKEYSMHTLDDGEVVMRELEGRRSEIQDLHDGGHRVAIKNPSAIYNAKHINRLLRAKTRLIVCIRNPVRWLKSYYNYRLQQIDKGHESLPPGFERAPEFSAIMHDHVNFVGAALDKGLMGKVIRKNILKSRFYEPDLVHFIIQEEFETNHAEVLDGLLAFLGIPDSERKQADYHFEYQSSERWKYFNDDTYDDELYRYYADDMRLLCQQYHTHADKDLKSIWEKFYSISLD